MRYRARPIEIDAFCWQGGDPVEQADAPVWALEALDDGRLKLSGGFLFVMTLEGRMRAESGHWIVRGTEGELYPVRPTVFGRKYEPVDPAAGDVAEAA